jgi:hypothetical protein
LQFSHPEVEGAARDNHNSNNAVILSEVEGSAIK